MRCAACSTENQATAKFCQSCGVPLAMAQPPASMPKPGGVDEPKSAGLRITPTAIGIAVLLLISVVGTAYVGWTWYEDSSRPNETARVDEKAIEEKRRKAEQDRFADERQKALEAEREKQRQQADAEQAMKLAQAKADEDRRRADGTPRAAEENAKRAEAKAQEAKAQQEAKARELAKAKEEARARELARQREERASQARAAAQAKAAAVPVATQAPAPAPAPVQPAPTQVAQAPAAPPQNEPCAGLSGVKREQCTSCNRHSGLRKSACESRALDRYCESRWNKPGEPECVDPRRR